MKFLLIFCFVLSIISCNTNTKHESVSVIQFVDTFNLPKDSLAFYFPVNSFSAKPHVDSFVQNWYSSALYSFREPILSQGFKGHNTYRFLWMRSFHRPVVFSLHQNQNRVWLNTKMLDKQPLFYDDMFGGISKENQSEYLSKGYVVDSIRPDILVKKADRQANIIYDSSITLTEKEWHHVEQLLIKANFWNLPSRIDDGSNDGAQWIFEVYFDNKYHIVDNNNPEGYYRKLGLFLIKLSGLKEEIY